MNVKFNMLQLLSVVMQPVLTNCNQKFIMNSVFNMCVKMSVEEVVLLKRQMESGSQHRLFHQGAFRAR